MFDDPKKELQRLQERLLAEEDRWEPEEDADQALEEVKQILAREDWEEDSREPLYRSYLEEESENWAEELPPEEPVSQKKKKKKKGTGALVTAAVLELLALGALAAWWLRWR